MEDLIFDEPIPFPGQDPWIVPWAGQLLLVESAAHNRAISIRRFRDLASIRRNHETVVWNPHRHGDHSQQIWAPELHYLEDRWYLYFSASDGENRNHRCYVLVADHPLGPYEELGRLTDHWSIDMTVLRHNGVLYALWSGWEEPSEAQNVFIAPMTNPWTLCGEPTIISRPEHGWEMSVAPINEGPRVLRNKGRGKLFVTYSADASWTEAYKIGVLEWVGGDVTRAAAWRKLPRPILTGGGRACFVDDMAVYHRKLGSTAGWADRVLAWEPLSWDAEGYPIIGPAGPRAVERQSAPMSPVPGG